MKKNTLLGNLTPAQFMRVYWHKKPLLIRQAIPGFTPLLSREALFNLASQADAESRLISHNGKQWRLENGPFDALPPLTRKKWTLLVQGVNLHDESADRLLRQFNFISNARLDDLMISYASAQGGVGPHFDSYDVFLLQAYGQRRWQIGNQKDLTIIDGLPLKILKDFQPDQEFVLNPGDMLYLPPHYAHDGVALNECMTYSIGFRAPSYQELGEGFLQFMADSIELPGRYADPDSDVSKHPAEISNTMLERIASELNKIRFTQEDISIFLGEYLSEPKPSVFFDPPAHRLSFENFCRHAFKQGLILPRKTQMLYHKKFVFINGESFAVSRMDKDTLCKLADARRLENADLKLASNDVLEALHAWYQDGWIVFA